MTTGNSTPATPAGKPEKPNKPNPNVPLFPNAAWRVGKAVNGKPVNTFTELMRQQNDAAGKPLEVGIVRKQQPKTIRVTTYTYVSLEPGTPADDCVPIRAITTKPATQNDPVATFFDDDLAEGYGSVFANGTIGGAYKVDLGKNIDVAEIKTWSFNQNKKQGTQHLLYSAATQCKIPVGTPVSSRSSPK